MMKKQFFLGACLVALASPPAMAQAVGPQVVVVRVSDNGVNVYVAISRGGGKPETMTFTSGKSNRHLGETADAYQQLLTKLYQEGYNLKSTFTAPEALVTLVFVKG